MEFMIIGRMLLLWIPYPSGIAMVEINLSTAVMLVLMALPVGISTLALYFSRKDRDSAKTEKLEKMIASLQQSVTEIHSEYELFRSTIDRFERFMERFIKLPEH